jgi:hypothetical protein
MLFCAVYQSFACAYASPYELWHRHLTHVNHDDVKKFIAQELVIGIKLNSRIAPDPICEPCLAGKMKANPFPATGHIAAKPLDLIHIDVHEPVHVQSHSGHKYYALFVDDCTKFKVGIPMKKKSKTFSAFLKFEAYAENQFKDTIKAIQDNKGGECMSKEFNDHCDKKGIVCRHTVCNRSQQNGSAGEHITSMFSEVNLPMQYSCMFGIVVPHLHSKEKHHISCSLS